jgi:SAM-dependent methyltransferase
MRIIAVGDPSRSPPPQTEQSGDSDPDSYPPSAARLGTGTRRSSRPVMAAVTAPAAPVSDVAPGKPPAVELAPAETAVGAPTAPAEAGNAEHAPAPGADVTEELADEDVAPDSGEKKIALADAEELGREDAISVLPEEVPAFQAEAKTDPGKPPPPPKRSAGTPASAPLSEPAAPPPTPDLAAAKAAQRKNTRQPWWEDLFNEDFMRATARISDEQIRREVTFIEDSLGVAAGGVVLDLGCGAGHHAVEFASRGYGVVGYDLSLYQLALAADVAQERSQKINFLQGDMREMAFEEMFDGVFCWNTTFGYFEEDKNLAVAQRVFKALRPGGMFLIDVINRDFAAASAPCTVWYEGDSCVCMDDMSVDFISSRLRVKRSIILDDGRTKESLFSLRLYSLHELGKLLHEVGFRVTEASGHPATPGVFFGPNSPRIIMLAQRP